MYVGKMCVGAGDGMGGWGVAALTGAYADIFMNQNCDRFRETSVPEQEHIRRYYPRCLESQACLCSRECPVC